jgi:hypothetical protein
VHISVILLARLENINEMEFEFQWKYQKQGYRNFLQKGLFWGKFGSCDTVDVGFARSAAVWC